MTISPGTLMLSEKDILYRLKMCNADTVFCDSSVMRKIDKDTMHLPWRILVEETQAQEDENLR